MVQDVWPSPRPRRVPFDVGMDTGEVVPRLAWHEVAVAGGNASYGVGGEGPPVVFLHGWGLSGRTYRAGLKRLLARGCACGRPRFRASTAPRISARRRRSRRVRRVGRRVLRGRRTRRARRADGALVRRWGRDPDRARLPRRVRGLVLINSIGGSAWRRHGSIVQSVAQRPLWDWGLHLPQDIFPVRQMRRVLPVILEAAIPNAMRDPHAFWHARTSRDPPT